MAEPQPSDIREGATEGTPDVATSGEDRKTQAALSSLETTADDGEAPSKKDVDSDALGKAMQNLEVKDGAGPRKAPTETKKVVKIDAADVTLLMSELLLSNVKAGDLLRLHDGNAVKAMLAYVATPIV